MRKKYAVVYNLGAYDHVLEEDIPTIELAHAVVTGLQSYHDKPLEVKPMDDVRRVHLKISGELLYDLVVMA